MSINDNMSTVGQYRLHASIEPARKIFVVIVEDHEGCGTIRNSVHATLDGATDVLREWVVDEFEGYEEFDDNYNSEMSADKIEELLSDELGKTAKVEQHEVVL
ncbi:hypothetical protein FF100_13460 [Methylobacterium terricola]|uniref:Uncharacterized protein n=1 Tax=Methylobacterium terricola TaxID=2583531 RepID=A0A5C4LH32_9HYPH|nr:hypothetical protein [Methylobacterium terricola]TNC12680.1 hypothetical protein FF100_13460 [Methylobacterium terricola]